MSILKLNIIKLPVFSLMEIWQTLWILWLTTFLKPALGVYTCSSLYSSYIQSYPLINIKSLYIKLFQWAPVVFNERILCYASPSQKSHCAMIHMHPSVWHSASPRDNITQPHTCVPSRLCICIFTFLWDAKEKYLLMKIVSWEHCDKYAFGSRILRMQRLYCCTILWYSKMR